MHIFVEFSYISCNDFTRPVGLLLGPFGRSFLELLGVLAGKLEARVDG